MTPQQSFAILQEFAGLLCTQYGLEGSLSLLFRFLARQVPSERLVCLSCERREHLISVLLDYNVTGKETLPLSIFVDNPLSWELIHELKTHSETSFNAHTVSDTYNNLHLNEFYNSIGIPSRSILGGTLYENTEEDRIVMLMLLHSEPDVFLPDHVELVDLLAPLLSKLVMKFVKCHPSPYLHFDNNEKNGQDAEALLRRCPSLRNLMFEIEAVAPTSSQILIQGESGTGKELVMETVHRLSTRASGPLIRINCAAIPESLLASELFGHEKGAFTGATSTRRGVFEQAQNGTLYLDEIGELPMNAQAYLLRVLENKSIRRVGGEREIEVNTRVIAATNRNLPELVRQGTFRRDLWYRLYAYPLSLTPLRQRRDDIPVLVQHFFHTAVDKFGYKHPPRLSANAVAELQKRSWPGNVRELEQLTERSLIRSQSQGLSYLQFEPDDHSLEDGPPMTHGAENREKREREALLDALRLSEGKIQGPNGAAKILQVNPNTVRYRMRKMGIPLPRDKKK